ncbi:hypothetical protein BP6252_08046 [Coleophoma cylindrospora]|uniref:Thiol-specific monooxygenase n=1 Tax=Coleophoma cylindrospora TaxID=1849047 RepID=A0A3D8RBP9_9HELO|nr:hypothetical protein BP6252_08046 [Coleophoma cylindrospora]
MGSIARSFAVKRIAIIGAGPSGLAAAKYLKAESVFSEIDVYEQQSEVGGVWNYTPNIAGKTRVPQTNPQVPLDEPIWPKGASVPLFSNPMYDHLNTNIPKDLMQFSDQPFLAESLLFPTREDVQDYLVRYSQDVRNLILFSTQVQNVRYEDCWKVFSKSLGTNEARLKEYDAVIVASGHYTVPIIPSVKGIEAFHAAYPSVISHSKTYRNPSTYKDKKVIVVGSAASGLDIGNQISDVCQKPLLNSVRTFSPIKPDPRYKEELPPIVEFVVEDRAVKFADGRLEKGIDAVVYCTGYLYSYPFLDSLDPPIVTSGQRVIGLYKHFISISHPTLAFTALQKKVIPFPLSEVQSSVLAKLWSNKLQLPQKQDMLDWENQLLQEKGDTAEFHVLGTPGDGQYINDTHDWAMTADGPVTKEPPYWGKRLQDIRAIFADIRKKFIENGASAKTLEDLGLHFESDD